MKINKHFKRISLISLILIVFTGCLNYSYASVFSDVVDNIGTFALEGIVGVLTLGIQQFALAIFGALQVLTTAITGVAGDGVAATIGDVVFNRCGLTSANFFPEVWVGEEVKFGTASADMVANISKYYVIIRNLSIAILLGILLYVGIRMAISTVASEEAKYKKMLKDWAVSLVLVFVLHYIIILTFFINNVLVNALASLDTTTVTDYAGLIAQGIIPGYGWADVIVYGGLVIGTLAFVLMYLKRTIVLGFLIVISPLITITYSLDKMGDGKSQALNTWLKEFIFTVIIQPFHCIIYLVFYASIMGALDGANELNMGNVIFAIASVFFMLKAEGIVKKIFGIQPNSIGDALGAGAMAITMASSIFKAGKGKKIAEGRGDMKKMRNNVSRRDANENIDTSSNRNAAQTSSSTDNNDSNLGGNETPVGENNEAQNTAKNESSEKFTTSDANEQPIQDAIKKTSKLKKELKDHWKRNGGMSGFMGRKISGAATMVGFIAGSTVGDLKTAIPVATALGGFAKTKYDNHEYNKNERILETNQQVFAGAYEDFAKAYREEYGEEQTDQQIRAAARTLYESGGDNLKDYESDFYSQMEQLSESAEIMGYSDGFNYVNESMRLAAEGEIQLPEDYIPKNYRANTSNSSSKGKNSNRSSGRQRRTNN